MRLPPTQRFTSRVENYRKYRPGYPPEIIPYLAEHTGFTHQSIIADIGSGTGLLTQLFLEFGNTVFAIEPNQAMRAAAEEALSKYPNFTSLDASAEATTLPDQSIDLIAAAQAFHWFDHAKTKIEFQRILKPGGTVLLIWNTRDQSSLIVRAYEEVIDAYCPKRASVVHSKTTNQTVIENFFAPHPVTSHSFPNSQTFDYPALRGRLLSSSYAPPEDHPNHLPMLTALKQAFDRHQVDGLVEFKYRTELFLGMV